MFNKKWILVIFVILLNDCFDNSISMPILKVKSERSSNLEQQLSELQNSHRRSRREDPVPKRKPEHTATVTQEEFEILFQKYLDLFRQLKKVKYQYEDVDIDDLEGSKGDRDVPNSQSGNVNVYVKGSVHIKGPVHINTNGNGNGMRNSHDSKGKDSSRPPTIMDMLDSDTVEAGQEDPNSDVVIIPRNQYGNKIVRRRMTRKLPFQGSVASETQKHSK